MHRTLQCTATHYNTLQHTATHHKTLQHTPSSAYRRDSGARIGKVPALATLRILTHALLVDFPCAQCAAIHAIFRIVDGPLRCEICPTAICTSVCMCIYVCLYVYMCIVDFPCAQGATIHAIFHVVDEPLRCEICPPATYTNIYIYIYTHTHKCIYRNMPNCDTEIHI